MQSYFLPLYNDAHLVAMRSKLDVIRNLMNIIKLMAYTPYAEQPYTDEYVAINTKLHRVFIKRENQLQTFRFALNIVTDIQSQYLRVDYRGSHINAAHTSAILSAVKEEDLLVNTHGCIERVISENEFGVECDFVLTVISALLNDDAGYLRYDYDEKNENEQHPLNHLDLYYSDSSSLKIGLEKAFDHDLMCCFLSKSSPAFILREK